MIKIDKTYYLKTKQALKDNIGYELESIDDIKQKLIRVWPNGYPLQVSTYVGEWDTRQCVTCDNFWFDDAGNPTDEELHFVRGRSIDDVWDCKLDNLQDELELLYIILKDFGTEKRNDKLLDFRYKYRGIMDRFPIMIDAWGMLPEHPKEFGSTSNHKMISECYRKFLLAEKQIIDSMPPESCPDYLTLKECFDNPDELQKLWDETIKRNRWNKEEYMLGAKLIKEMLNGKHKWANNKQVNLFKWASLKYTFNGEFKTSRQLKASYKTAKQRPSKIF